MPVNEFLYVGSLIIFGGTLGHLALLSLAKNVSRHNVSVSSSSFHGLKVSHKVDHAPSPISETPKRPLTTASRGFLPSVSERRAVIEKSWSNRDRSYAIHTLVVATRQQNYRSTYLGAKSFDGLNPSAQLFGWHRVTGKATVQLGEIAQVTNDNNEAALHLLLHPEDAHMVTSAGWGKRVKTKVWRTSSVGQQMTQGVQILLSAPRNQNEVEQVTSRVLEAAIWFVAGLDREEDV